MGILLPMSFGIEKIALGLPKQKVAPQDLGFGKDDAYYARVSGARQLHRASAEEKAVTLCERAAEKMAAGDAGYFREVDAIFVVTMPSEATVAPISPRLQAKLGLPSSVFCLDFTLSCVGFLQAVSVLLGMMPERKWRKALLFNVETLSKIIAREDKALQLVMSDAATLSLFSDTPKITFSNFEFGADGTQAGILEARNGAMFMDGPKLYETVLRTVPGTFAAHLEKSGHTRESVDFFAFHQGSRRVLDKLAEALELPAEKVLDGITEVGNTGSCAIPHLLGKLLEQKLPAGQIVCCTAFGAGYQWAHAIARLGGSKP